MPTVCATYRCEVRRAQSKALYFAIGAGHARFLLSEPDAVRRLCLKPVLGRHCNPWHSTVLQTLASKVYIHLTVLHFILVLYMRHQTSAVLIKLFESADGKAVTSPLKLLPGKRFRRCFMWPGFLSGELFTHGRKPLQKRAAGLTPAVLHRKRRKADKWLYILMSHVLLLFPFPIHCQLCLRY